MIALKQEELDQFIEDYMESWHEEKGAPDDFHKLTDAVILIAMQHTSCLIAANNQRIEEDLRRLGRIV